MTQNWNHWRCDRRHWQANRGHWRPCRPFAGGFFRRSRGWAVRPRSFYRDFIRDAPDELGTVVPVARVRSHCYRVFGMQTGH